MKDEFFWKEFVAEIENEINNIDKLNSELKKVLTEQPIFSERIKASIFHDFYNSCERIFKKIATVINGGFVDQDRWHKELLYHMTMEIKDIRPRVISDELAAELDDYLAFRHLFRNIYGFELKGNRLSRLTEKFENICNIFRKEITDFLRKLASNKT